MNHRFKKNQAEAFAETKKGKGKDVCRKETKPENRKK